jgi:drug/metabolite transporter (DMT)-like permease
MNATATLIWPSNVAFEVCGHLAFKQVARRSSDASGLAYWRQAAGEPMLWLGLAALLIEFVLWFCFLALVPLSMAVLVSSINIVGVMLGGRLLFGEHITTARSAAIALILARRCRGWLGRRMRATFFFGFAVLVAFTVLCQVASKLAAQKLGVAHFDFAWLASALHEPLFLLILLGNIGAFFTYLSLLQGAAVGPIFAATHLSVVAVIAVSLFFLRESLSPLQGVGSLLIVAGVVILGVTEKSEPAG